MEVIFLIIAIVGTIIGVVANNKKKNKSKLDIKNDLEMHEQDSETAEAMELFGFDEESVTGMTPENFVERVKAVMGVDNQSTEAQQDASDTVSDAKAVPRDVAQDSVDIIKAQPQKEAYIYATSTNNAPGDLAHNYKPIEGTIKTHTHGGGTREERGIPTETSIAGAYEKQGCAEHYNSRFVKEEEQAPVRDNEQLRHDLRVAIVLGEVINKPAFKRRAGKIR